MGDTSRTPCPACGNERTNWIHTWLGEYYRYCPACDYKGPRSQFKNTGLLALLRKLFR